MADATLPSANADVPSSKRTIEVVLVGNPNTGKTTLFNALTGLRHRVGNYAGVTVETRGGTARRRGATFHVTDVPGTYSLSPRSPDEMLTVDLLLGHRKETRRPDVILCIADASNLERNLYLATQVQELGVPMVLALNMIDVAESLGVRIDVRGLSRSLGIPVVAIQANAHRGLDELTDALVRSAGGPPPIVLPRFPDAYTAEVDRLVGTLRDMGSNLERFLVERALLDTGGQTERILRQKLGGTIGDELESARQRLRQAGCPVPAVEARSRYAWIADRLAGVIERPTVRKVTLTDRIDKILMHRVWGLVVFLALMAVVFQSIFAWADPLMGLVETSIGAAGAGVGSLLPEGPIHDLVVDGIVGGVGGVLVFLPQIMILFGFIALLEDCGYMARAAFLMDRVMAPCGLSGKSFIPLLSSFACAIPGIMATRTIEDRRDRFATILVAPLMSCSARLPVYILLIGATIPAVSVLGFVQLQALVLLAMYLVGIVAAPLVVWALKRSLLRGDAPIFLMELPSYKIPSLATVCHRMVDRGWAFVRRAGTLILATSVVVWALQYYPRDPSLESEFAEKRQAITSAASQDELGVSIDDQLRHLRDWETSLQQERSYLGRIGKWIEPAVKPLGWDWRIGMAAVASFPAREVVVATLGIIYGVGQEEDEGSTSLRSAIQEAKWPDGRTVFTIPAALSLMVFFALCCQCAATLAVIRRETRSWFWPIFTFVYMTGLAYVGALVVYQVGSRWIT